MIDQIVRKIVRGAGLDTPVHHASGEAERLAEVAEREVRAGFRAWLGRLLLPLLILATLLLLGWPVVVALLFGGAR